MWDDEVDVVCTGAGASGLGSAIAVIDLGGTVFVADPPADEASVTRPWLDANFPDPETSEYFAAMASDLATSRRSPYDLDVPIRAVVERRPRESGRTVAPFVGSRLRDWTARCLATPYGYLYTRLTDWRTTTTQTADGDLVEVTELGTMTVDSDDVGGSVVDRVTAWAVERGIEVNTDTALGRIVFEEGRAIGAVFSTPDGPLAIRARRGVAVTAGATPVHSGAPTQLRPTADSTVRVCLVGQHASRFGRLELLTSEPLTIPASPVCPATSLQAGLHGTHDRSHVWRCAKVHGYPALGQ